MRNTDLIRRAGVAGYLGGLALALVCLVVPGWVFAQPQSLDRFWRGSFQRPAEPPVRVTPNSAHVQALGKTLFFDPRLSGGQTRSCASCHQPDRSYTDGLKRARSASVQGSGLRNTPTLYGLGEAKVLNWDGSAVSLEHQALGPITGAGELAGDFAVIIKRLQQDKDIARAFRDAFPDQQPALTPEAIARALGAYVRTLTPPRTKIDAWSDGDDAALDEKQKNGLRLFVGKAGCVACHSGWRLTDDSFHDIGLAQTEKSLAGAAGEIGVRAFKTPTLRAIQSTAPYMHDGRFSTLRDVIDHYADGVQARKGVSVRLPKSLKLSADERDALIAFLKAL